VVCCLYTDGLVDAENPEGDFISQERLQATALAHVNDPAEKIVEAIYAAVAEFRGNRNLEDDATLLVVKVT
jgi:phosphoserine phosphatase RsbU/P